MTRNSMTLVALALSLAMARPAVAGGGKVTYIANEGFLIEAGGKKILIDAFFSDPTLDFCHVPDAETLRRLEAAEAPFDDVDLVLITHKHVDHFAPLSVLRHLSANAGALAVGPPQVISALRAQPGWTEGLDDRVRELDLGISESAPLSVPGINVEVVRLRHSKYLENSEETGETIDRHRDVENLAYLADLDGFKIVHVGDALLRDNPEAFEKLELGKRGIDVLFLQPYYWPDELPLAKEWIAPGDVVFMHLHPSREMLDGFSSQVRDSGSEAVIFTAPMQARSF
ncbi:MAG: MBL fold metallo-hydrolase [bacterium]|nr:MBL fold metallo-hydrolase [bacterium]